MEVRLSEKGSIWWVLDGIRPSKETDPENNHGCCNQPKNILEEVPDCGKRILSTNGTVSRNRQNDRIAIMGSKRKTRVDWSPKTRDLRNRVPKNGSRKHEIRDRVMKLCQKNRRNDRGFGYMGGFECGITIM